MLIDASLEARCLVESSATVGYVVIVVSKSFRGRGITRLYDFLCLTKPRKRCTLLVTKVGAKRGSWRKL